MPDPGQIPAVVLVLASTVVLALVVFNVPLLKSLYFFKGEFSSGGYEGTLTLGPQIGYSLDLNTLLGVSLFNIPSAVSKWMSYTLVLHIVALVLVFIGLLAGLLDMIPGFGMMCFPTCFTSMGAGVTLIALIFDLAMFYILKARVDAVSGASATIGPAVWMTLAAWLLACFAGCMWGMGRCCCGQYSSANRNRRRDRDREVADAEHDMRLGAIRDEQRRLKEMSKEPERMPLTQGEEDKYLYEEAPALGRNGSVLQGVGVGYGRRDKNDSYGYAGGAQRQPSVNSHLTAPGAAGVGAGGAGVAAGHNNYVDPYAYDPNQLETYDEGYGQQQQNYGQPQQYGQQNHYNDPYANNPDPYQQSYAADPYGQQQQAQGYNQYSQPTYPPAASAAAVAGGVAGTRGGHNNDYYTGATSNESHGYADPGPRVAHAEPYGYEDDGLGAIGRAAASASGERQYTGHQGFGLASPPPTSPPAAALSVNTAPAIHTPTPQHLICHNPSTILSSPVSEYTSDPSNSMYSTDGNRPPSYGQVASGNTYVQPTEKGRPV